MVTRSLFQKQKEKGKGWRDSLICFCSNKNDLRGSASCFLQIDTWDPAALGSQSARITYRVVASKNLFWEKCPDWVERSHERGGKALLVAPLYSWPTCVSIFQDYVSTQGHTAKDHEKWQVFKSLSRLKGGRGQPAQVPDSSPPVSNLESPEATSL